jgi:hypothetical protein
MVMGMFLPQKGMEYQQQSGCPFIVLIFQNRSEPLGHNDADIQIDILTAFESDGTVMSLRQGFSVDWDYLDQIRVGKLSLTWYRHGHAVHRAFSLPVLWTLFCIWGWRTAAAYCCFFC